MSKPHSKAGRGRENLPERGERNDEPIGGRQGQAVGLYEGGGSSSTEGAGFSFARNVDKLTGGDPQTEPVQAGDRLSGFVLVERLAAGAQGEVWVARQPSLERRVALKLMHPDRLDGKARELFMREARAGGRLSHPGIVTVYDHGTTSGHAWIAMELVEGACTLRDSLDEVARDETLPDDYYRRGAALVAQIADALQAAHDAGVIHRDVKPRNILISNDDRPKVTDFGLARITDEMALSVTGDVMGTYAYMSPEQVEAKRTGIDHRTDIFSLGVVTYELLSLRRPFTGKSVKEITNQIQSRDPPDLRRIRAGIPRDLAVICSKALAKTPRDRYQTMAELAADLRRFLADEPIVARPPSPVRRLTRWVRRHPTGGALALTVTAALAALYVSTRSSAQAPFTGPEDKLWSITDSPDDDGSPTFVGTHHIVFERRADERSRAGLWSVDLDSDRTARPWSPDGEVCESPAVSPDGAWITYETPSGSGTFDSASRAIVVRRLEASSDSLPWPEEEYERIEYERSVGGVAWSRTARFVYTRDLGTRLALMFHDMRGPWPVDLELARTAKRGLAHIPAYFSPEDDRVIFLDGNVIRTAMLDPEAPPVAPYTLDCGSYTDPVWLQDDSILMAGQWSGEVSTHLYWLANGELEPMGELEKHLIGGYGELAVTSDESMLALVAQVKTSSLYISSPRDPLPVEFQLRFPPVQPIWTPEGRVLYCANTTEGLRLFIFDPRSGADEPLEFDLPFVQRFEGNYQLDQPSFSQHGALLTFRAKGEQLNGSCDPLEWIVIAPWPPDGRIASALSMGGRYITGPNATDAGDRVIWCESGTEGMSVFGATVEAGHPLDVELRMKDANWPARISGDGRWIAASRNVDDRVVLRIFEWEGAEVITREDGAVNIQPVWSPNETGAGNRVAYLHVDASKPDQLSVEAVDTSAPEDTQVLGSLPASDENPTYATLDPLSARLVYTIWRTKGGNIWLVSPVDKGV